MPSSPQYSSRFFIRRFGPVESLGVSIFVGLSSNYLLHVAHAYHNSNIKERNAKIQRAAFVTGSPIVWSAVSTIGGSAFLFACRTWLLTELGILICTVIGLSLVFSLGFLLALLAMVGPLPVEFDGKPSTLHSFDLMTIWRSCLGYLWKDNSDRQIASEEESEELEEQRAQTSSDVQSNWLLPAAETEGDVEHTESFIHDAEENALVPGTHRSNQSSRGSI